MKLWDRVTVVVVLLVIWFASMLDENALQRRLWDEPAQPVTLYFGESDAMGVSPEIRWFRSTDVDPERLIEALIEGPRDPRLIASIPPSTRVIGTQIQGDIIAVNFENSIVRDHP